MSVKRYNSFGSCREDLPTNATLTNPRRLSLEEKILRLVRQYRAREKRRLKKQNALPRSLPVVSEVPRSTRPGLDAKPSQVFEQAARVWSASTLAGDASAAAAPAVPGLVAGRLLATSGHSFAGEIGLGPGGRRLVAR
jgi:hypothetical protein